MRKMTRSARNGSRPIENQLSTWESGPTSAPLSSGAYRVEWRVIAGDGDPMSGQFSFTLALPPELEPTTAAPTHAAPTNAAPTTAPPSTPEPRSPSVADGGRGSGASPWWWLLAALVVVGVLAAAVVVSRRRGRTGAAP